MKFVIKYTLILSTLFSSQFVFASTNKAIVCNSCGSNSLMQMALSDYYQSGHSGTYLLVSYDNNVLQKVRMMYEPEMGMVIPTSATISNEEEAEYSFQKQLWDTLNYALRNAYESNISAGSYDIMDDHQLQNLIIEDYKNNSNINRSLRNIILSILNVSTGKIALSGVDLDIRINLSDGGQAYLVFAGLTAAGALEPRYNVIKIVDKEGNEVPSKDLEDGRLVFRFADEQNFGVFMQFMQDNFNINRDEIEVTYRERMGNPKKPNITVIDLENGNATIQAPPQDEDTPEDP